MAKLKYEVAVGRPDYSEILEMFEVAVEKCSSDKADEDAPYWDGVRQALGWVIGAYTDKPEEE